MKAIRSFQPLIWLIMVAFTACSKGSSDPKPESNTNIQGMYFIAQYGYNGYGIYSYFTPFLLLKDGSIKKDIIQPPGSLDETQSKQSEPDKWGRWSKSGTTIHITWNDGKTEKWDTWYYGLPAEKGEKLSGTYESLFSVVNQQYEGISFTADGKFSVKKDNGNSVQTLTGTYILNGYGITLDYDNGQTEEWSFVFYCKGKNTESPQKDTSAFLMAEDNYSSE